jgi:hypothetical protein
MHFGTEILSDLVKQTACQAKTTYISDV